MHRSAQYGMIKPMDGLFFTQLPANSIVLTPNQRLSTHLLAEYYNWQRAQGHHVWVTPNIFPINTWLTLLWQTLPAIHTLLTYNQQLQIWQIAIEQSSASEQILDSFATARLAQEAWGYLRQSQHTLADIQEFANIEITIFTEWAHYYQTYCAQKCFIDHYALIEQLQAQQTQLVLPSEIYLAGFDGIVPQIKHFLEGLPCTLHHVEPSQPAQAQVIGLENQHSEIQTMLRWAQHLHLTQPQAKVICVVPNFEQCRPELVRQTQALFFPHAITQSDVTQHIVNISSGYPLHQTAVVKIALLLLTLTAKEINYHALSELLTTPYIGGNAAQLSPRALLDNHLRKLNEPNLRWRTILNTIHEYQKNHSDLDSGVLLAMLEKFLWLHERQTDKVSPKQWQQNFVAILQAFDWPGTRSLSSHEHQQVQRFYEALDEFAQLAIDTPISRSQATKQLHQLVTRIIFQPKSKKSNIQILGLLEAAGLESDYMWIMGLDSTTWPAAANPNPFIPHHLQRKWQTPHSSAQNELQFSLTLQHRFMHSCRQLILSYPQHDTAQELQCSTLLKDIPKINIEHLNLSSYQPLTEKIQALNSVSTFNDDFGPELSQVSTISGGASILKSQAACPFQAFARYRLQAESIATPEISLSYADRGILLHTTLENIWAILGSQEKLLEISEDKLINHLQHAIERAFSQVLPYYWQKIKPQFKRLENQRLQNLLLAWLNIEKQRPAFTVMAQEHNCKFQAKNLTLNLRIDRIDQLENGKLLLIDYKSGKVNLKSLLEERLEEPQLPLYAVITQNIQAISFAEIKAEGCNFKGIASEDCHIPGINVEHEWQQLLQQWHTALYKLAEEFNQGIALVAPQPNVCNQCELTSLCRINEVITCTS